jgi:hypothetical protein
MNRTDNSVRPPRWAEMLLRIVLPSGTAETESGDLLEAYRDSVYPQLGSWRADLWFIRQVAGYILRARTTSLGNWILAGLMLCVFTTAFSAIRYPELIAPLVKHIGLMCVGILIYVCAAVLGTRPRNERHVLVLRLGTRWGIATGVLWIVSYLCANLVIPHRLGAGIGVTLALVAFLLPLASGSHGALKTGRMRDGISVSFWSGLISGVMTFLGLLAIGYVLAFVPGFPGAEIPSSNHVYTAREYEYANVSDVLGGSFAHLFLINGALGVIGGTIGSCAAILLERTGKGPEASDPA